MTKRGDEKLPGIRCNVGISPSHGGLYQRLFAEDISKRAKLLRDIAIRGDMAMDANYRSDFKNYLEQKITCGDDNPILKHLVDIPEDVFFERVLQYIFLGISIYQTMGGVAIIKGSLYPQFGGIGQNPFASMDSGSASGVNTELSHGDRKAVLADINSSLNF